MTLRPPRFVTGALLYPLSLFVLGPGVAAQDVSSPQRNWNLQLTKLDAGDRIVVDGYLDEAAWQKAAKLGPLTQVDPIEGAKPTQPTEVRMCYDRDHLYLSVLCHDEPENVRGRMMQRDARLEPDDRVEWWLDTFQDRRFAYWFQIGPGGSKGDALLGGGRFNKSWDGIWEGEARVTSKGWQAEIAIPFKTLSFRAGADTWRFNFARKRRVNDEEDRWAEPNVAYRFFSLAQGGTITGFEGIRQGVGLDVVPYVKGGAGRDRTTSKHTSITGDAGLDVNYRITPALNMRLTFNTDFAETEVDTRQSNLTRFPLFFPEKRGFFLEDAGVFEFGPSSRRPRLTPFFSRRIGRDDEGAAIPILVGAKLTGRVDDWILGFLDVFQDDHVDSDGKASDDRSLAVIRVNRHIGQESSVGFITTLGRPTDPGAALTTGIDFKVADSRAFGAGKGFEIDGWWLGTQLAGPGGDGHAYGLKAEYDSKNWQFELGETHIEKDFAPKLGFVRRTGIREHRLEAGYTWRSEDGDLLRRWSTRVIPTLLTTEQGADDMWRVWYQVGEFTFRSDDQISWSIRREHERLRDTFEIADGVVIPIGSYDWTQNSFRFQTASARWAYLRGELRFGGFYNGNITSYELEPTLILGKHVQVAAGYEQNHVVLDQGRFTTHLYNARLDISFSPDVSLKNFVQYDTDSKNLGAQSRLRWIHEPGRELFLVGLYGWERAASGAPFVPTTQELALKVFYTLRF